MKRRAHAKRRDLNEPLIVEALRRSGCTVYLLDGPVDLLVCTPWCDTLMIEVKRGELAPAHRGLTDAEAAFFRVWTGRCGIVRCLEEALCLVVAHGRQGAPVAERPNCRQRRRNMESLFCECGRIDADPSWLDEWRAEERVKAKEGREDGVKLTEKDQDMLRDIENASALWDGFAPHGQADGRKIARLRKMGLVEHAGIGECQSCRDPHDVQIYVLTEAGKAERA